MANIRVTTQLPPSKSMLLLQVFGHATGREQQRACPGLCDDTRLMFISASVNCSLLPRVLNVPGVCPSSPVSQEQEATRELSHTSRSPTAPPCGHMKIPLRTCDRQMWLKSLLVTSAPLKTKNFLFLFLLEVVSWSSCLIFLWNQIIRIKFDPKMQVEIECKSIRKPCLVWFSPFQVVLELYVFTNCDTSSACSTNEKTLFIKSKQF